MIEETNILLELQKTNALLVQLIETIEQGNLGKRTGTVGAGGKGKSSNLSDDEKQSLEYEIDLEWWFVNYGEEPLPAKYMCSSMGAPTPNTNPYSKDENEYLFNRLMDFVEEENEAGTHVFRYMNKIWCKRESNARNCFAFVPVKKGA